MYREDRNVLLALVAGIVVVVLVGFGGAFIGASFEARAYRKFCDTPVTAWDAMFLDLRVDECGRRER